LHDALEEEDETLFSSQNDPALNAPARDALEARLRLSARAPAVVHGRDSFKRKYERTQFVEYKAQARTWQPSVQHQGAVTVTGEARSTDVALPATLQPSAMASLNFNYLQREAGHGVSVKTASTTLRARKEVAPGFADFVLQPQQLDFGTVRKGWTYRMSGHLANAGSSIGRFQIVQPTNTDKKSLMHCRVLHRPGPIAAGLKKQFEVELFAGSLGAFSTSITVKTETLVFALPVRAHVVSSDEADRLNVRVPRVGAPVSSGAQTLRRTASQSRRLMAGLPPLRTDTNKARKQRHLSRSLRQQRKPLSHTTQARVNRSGFGRLGDVRVFSTSITAAARSGLRGRLPSGGRAAAASQQ
jgi:hypothetical protein